MDKSEKLKIEILKQYKSIREFAKEVDIPNSTLMSALERGIGGIAIEKAIRICEVLKLDVKTFDKLPISNEEKQPITLLAAHYEGEDLLRGMDKDQINDIIEFIKFKKSQKTK